VQGIEEEIIGDVDEQGPAGEEVGPAGLAWRIALFAVLILGRPGRLVSLDGQVLVRTAVFAGERVSVRTGLVALSDLVFLGSLLGTEDAQMWRRHHNGHGRSHEKQ